MKFNNSCQPTVLALPFRSHVTLKTSVKANNRTDVSSFRKLESPIRFTVLSFTMLFFNVVHVGDKPKHLRMLLYKSCLPHEKHTLHSCHCSCSNKIASSAANSRSAGHEIRRLFRAQWFNFVRAATGDW